MEDFGKKRSNNVNLVLDLHSDPAHVTVFIRSFHPLLLSVRVGENSCQDPFTRGATCQAPHRNSKMMCSSSSRCRDSSGVVSPKLGTVTACRKFSLQFFRANTINSVLYIHPHISLTSPFPFTVNVLVWHV